MSTTDSGPSPPVVNTAGEEAATTIPAPTTPTASTTTSNNQQQPQFTAQQQTIVQVRDRLFHALFYRISIMYARKFTKTFRRLIEFFVLMLAISSFVLLSYLHVVFNRNPVNCLASIQDKWPRDGVLRVEIVYNATQFYIMSYDEFPLETSSNVTNRTSEENATAVKSSPYKYGLKGR